MRVTFFPPGEPALVLRQTFNPIPRIRKEDGYYSLYLLPQGCGPEFEGFEAARYTTHDAALEDMRRIIEHESAEVLCEENSITIHIGGGRHER